MTTTSTNPRVRALADVNRTPDGRGRPSEGTPEVGTDVPRPGHPDGAEYRFCYRYALAQRSGTFADWQPTERCRRCQTALSRLFGAR